MAEDFLKEETRAEDIILGSLGFGEDATIVSIVRTNAGFKGIGRFQDGETFDFESEDALTELQLWALGKLVKSR